MYDRSYGERELEFEASGALWQASLVMRDRQTDSWWSIMRSRAIGGEMEGAELVELPVGEKATWGEWRARHPETLVLSVDGREHEGHNHYADYFAGEETFRGLEIADRRLEPKTPIFGFFLDGRPYAVPHGAVDGWRVLDAGEKARLLLWREPGAGLFDSTRAWRLAAGAAPAPDELPADGGLERDGAEPLAGIDTYWYTWIAINEGSAVLGGSSSEP